MSSGIPQQERSNTTGNNSQVITRNAKLAYTSTARSSYAEVSPERNQLPNMNNRPKTTNTTAPCGGSASLKVSIVRAPSRRGDRLTRSMNPPSQGLQNPLRSVNSVEDQRDEEGDEAHHGHEPQERPRPEQERPQRVDRLQIEIHNEIPSPQRIGVATTKDAEYLRR